MTAEERMAEADRRIERINEALRVVINADLMISEHAVLVIDSPETEADVDYLLGLGFKAGRWADSRFGQLATPMFVATLGNELLDYAVAQSETVAA